MQLDQFALKSIFHYILACNSNGIGLYAHLKSYSLELVNGKKTTTLPKASLYVYAKKVFSQGRIIAVEMKTTCFLASLGFFVVVVKILLSFEFDTISISTLKKKKKKAGIALTG